MSESRFSFSRTPVVATLAATAAFLLAPVLCLQIGLAFRNWGLAPSLAQEVMRVYFSFQHFPSLVAVAVSVLIFSFYGWRKAFRRPVLLLGFVPLCIILRVVFAIPFSISGEVWFDTTVMKISFSPPAEELAIRRALGTPMRREVAPDFFFAGNSPEAIGRKAFSNLIYVPPGGGGYRVFYFSVNGTLLFEHRGEIYF
jgi:hypothetical protein